MDDLPQKSGTRPTLVTIAQQLGVSSATVSLALRDSPQISPGTRARVKTVAREIGYQPDPEIGKLMHRLRTKRQPGFKSTINAFTNIPVAGEPPELRELIDGAELRATELGFGFAVQRVEPREINGPKLQRTLHSRGVEGLLLLPMKSPLIGCEDWLDWKRFSVVAATRCVTSPDFDRVVEHCFWSASTCLKELSALGYRRIGVIYNAAFDHANNSKLSAALACHRTESRYATPRPFVYTAPLVAHAEFPLLPEALFDGRLAQWFSRERPDVLVIDSERIAEPILGKLGLLQPGAVGLATLYRSTGSHLAGVEEWPREIGVSAIDTLSQKIITGSKGVSSVPRVTMIKGRWAATPSVSTQPRMDPRAPWFYAACATCSGFSLKGTPEMPEPTCLSPDFCPVTTSVRTD